MTVSAFVKGLCALSIAGYVFVGLVVLATIPESLGLTDPFWIRADFIPQPDDLVRRLGFASAFLAGAGACEVVRRNV